MTAAISEAFAEAPVAPGVPLPEALPAPEPEFDRLGLPLEPGARVAEVLKRQAAAAAEAEKAASIADEAERMRAVVEQLVELGWTVTPPAAR